jgi:Asp-tRNA(Asn)/Glu-tRNA(Gln) amidotransferase A subunit family amidase
LRTTFGSELHKDLIPGEDDAAIANIRGNGAIVAGKTNTPEFGAGASTFNRVFGTTVNPFDRRLSVAGSSGGSAAALAAGLLPLATGSDLGGSLRTPASFCGVVGFRPTPGVVPVDRSPAGWSPLTVEGPMARNARDAALLLAGMVGSSDKDPLSRTVRRDRLINLPTCIASELALACSEDLGFACVQRSERAAFRDKMNVLSRYVRSIDWDHPDLEDADFTFETLRSVQFLAAFSAYSPEQIARMSDNIRANLAYARGVSATDVANALAAQTRSWRRAQEFFSRYDALIVPAAAIPPFPATQVYPDHIDETPMRNYIQWFALGFGVSILAHPVICIPCGRGSTGLPFGIQVVGPYRRDVQTLSMGAALEEVFAGEDDLKPPLSEYLQ